MAMASCTRPMRAIFTPNRRQIEFDSHLQEGTFMTRKELQTNQEYMWRALSARNGQLSRSQLRCFCVAIYLLNRSSPKQ